MTGTFGQMVLTEIEYPQSDIKLKPKPEEVGSSRL